MLDQRLAGVQPCNLAGMDVETEHAVADVRIAQRQRQADIAEADDPDGCGLLLELLDHFGCHHKALKLSPVAGGGDHPTSPRTRSASLSSRSDEHTSELQSLMRI